MFFGIVLNMKILFCFCYFGALATNSFECMSKSIYSEINWHELPLEIQKHIILMLGNMQRSLYYHGFDVVTLDLNTFVRVSMEQYTSIHTLLIPKYSLHY